VTTRDIRPSTAITVCDVCGRTLLRGERAEAYVHGGTRRWVCELCKSRALHEGWIREGELPDYNAAGSGSERRRSFLGRLRARRETIEIPDLNEIGHPDSQPAADPEPLPAPAPPPAPVAANRREARAGREPRGGRGGREGRAGREARAGRESPDARESRNGREARSERESRSAREPRTVRAVPTSPEHKTGSAVQLFNTSEHPRTVAGVARSLGLPTVSVLPSPGHTSLVNVVVSWELCWYRYEVDLSEDVPSVRKAGQGYELDELAPEERQPNAVATEQGTLEFSG
jgi:hypothetical protein